MQPLAGLVALVLVLVLAGSALADVARSDTGNGTNNHVESIDGGSATLDLTTYTISAGTDLCLTAMLFTFTAGTTFGASAMVWDPTGSNQTMTLVAELDDATYGHLAVYRLVNPTTGNKTLRATWTTNSFATIGAIAWSGADQTTCIDAANTATDIDNSATQSIDVTASAGGVTVAVLGQHNTSVTSTDTQTEIWLENNLGTSGSFSGVGVGTNTHTWTIGAATFGAKIGVNVIAASASTVVPQRTLMGVGQ